MPPTMRAKFIINSVTTHESGESIKMSAVTNGTPEDNTFSKYTPSASLDISITNPALMGVYKPGQKFYVDFSPAE